MSGNTANTDKDPDRLRRARHETSHAICNVHYGIPFERVYIGKGGGRCRIALGRLGGVTLSVSSSVGWPAPPLIVYFLTATPMQIVATSKRLGGQRTSTSQAMDLAFLNGRGTRRSILSRTIAR
jgi:hypothetical protein